MKALASAFSLTAQPVAGNWREITVRAYFAIHVVLALGWGVMGFAWGARISTAPLLVGSLFIGWAGLTLAMMLKRVIYTERGLLFALTLESVLLCVAAWLQEYGVAASGMLVLPAVVCLGAAVGNTRTGFAVFAVTVGSVIALEIAVPGNTVPGPGNPTSMMRLYSMLGVLLLVYTVTRIFARALNLAMNLQESLVSMSPLPIVVVDLDANRVVKANSAYESLIGMSQAQMRAQAATTLDLFADAEQRNALYAALKRDRRVDGMPLTIVSQRGRVSQLLVSAQVMSVNGRRYTMMYGLDETEQQAQRDEMARMRAMHEQSLATALQMAQEGNRAKGEFLANISHEVRTPLNGIIGLSGIAREPGIGEARREELLGLIQDSAHSLLGLLNDVLDLSRIEAGRLELQEADFDVGALLQSMHEAHAPLAESRGLLLVTHSNFESNTRMRGDATRLRQILANLMSNALKFTPSGHVRLSCEDLGGHRLRFEVEDSGIGIRAEQQALLFNNFVQVDASATRARGGSGLGLAICRQLARMMGGDVSLSSRAGQGSRFSVVVQLQPPRGDTVADPSDLSAARFSGRLAGLRVLIVEDSPINMAITAHVIAGMGAQVLEAEDGEQACLQVEQMLGRNEPPDLILMDLHMPHMDGFDATRHIRRMQGGNALLIVALTASALLEQHDHAIEAGMDAFLTKPVRPGLLCDTVDAHRRSDAPGLRRPTAPATLA